MDVSTALFYLFRDRTWWRTGLICLAVLLTPLMLGLALTSWVDGFGSVQLVDRFSFGRPTGSSGSGLILAATQLFGFAATMLVFAHFTHVTERIADGESNPALPAWAGIVWTIERALQLFAVELGLIVIAMMFSMAIMVTLFLLGLFLPSAIFFLVGIPAFLGFFILVGLFSVVCLTRTVVTDSVGGGLSLGAAKRLLFARPGLWCLVAILPALVLLPAQIVLMITGQLTGELGLIGAIGGALAHTYAIAFDAHLSGQAYRASIARLSSPARAPEVLWRVPPATTYQ